ncbi:MAG: chordopoxvirus fusion protein [Calditrichia bacterium]|nr:chordopoxvirus fusion protein [Calditrichia bacterium]
MLDTLKIYNELKEKLEPEAALKIAEMMGYIYGELANTVTKADFSELREIVRDLGEAQKRTEQRLDSLTVKVEELAEAQKRTEQRLDSLTVKVEELAEAQKRTEQRLDSLTVKVEELAEAQKRTEQRVEELAAAQKRTETRVEELAEAQKRTEKSLAALADEHKETRRQLGGLSATVGYTLENEAYKALPALLEQDFQIKIRGRLDRDYIPDNTGNEIEVNILGRAEQNGKEILIVGESKSQLSRNDVDTFIRKKLKRLQGVHPHLFPILVTHMVSDSKVKKYAEGKGIALYKSSQF